jgi:hypothetical protein
MGIEVVVAVSLAAGCIALAFYMDWLGLWVSEEEMREKREQAKERMRLFRADALGLHPPANAGTGTVPGAEVSGRAFAFDVDAASLGSLREALPAWKIEVVNGATAASLRRDWNPRTAGLVVVGLRGNVAESLGLCRFLAFCNSYAGDFAQQLVGPREHPGNGQDGARREGALLLVLMPPGQEALLEGALDAGTHRCLPLPLQARDVTRLLVHPPVGNRRGRPTGPQGARNEDLWRDDGGQG